MLLRVDNTGRILEDADSLADGLHALGSVRGRIDPATLAVDPAPSASVTDLSDEEAVLLYGDAILLRIDEGCLLWVAPDISGARDVCLAPAGGGEWWIGDSFETIVGKLGAVTRNAAAITFFVPHGYFRNGETFFNEARRVRAGRRLCFGRDGQPREENIFRLCDPARWADRLNYAGFRDALESVFAAEGFEDTDAILLSGGVDSGIIAGLAALRFGKQPATYTHAYVQAMDSNADDAERSARVADLLGLPHVQVPVDFNKIELPNLDRLIDMMPLAAHFALNFLETMGAAAGRGARRAWCGQNADSVYNLGPTSRLAKGVGKGDLIKRFYLSREFLSTLPDIADRSWSDCITRLAARTGVRMSEYRYRRPFHLPANFNELLQSFTESDHYMALKTDAAGSHPPMDPPLGIRGARERLFEEKLATFLVGRDARCVLRAAAINSVHPILPFSAPNLMLFFRGLEQTWRDTLSPKRFMYRYYRELLGKQKHRALYRHTQTHDAPKTDTWQRWVLENSEIGKALTAAATGPAEALGLSAEFRKLQPPVSLYWYDRVRRTLTDRGAIVKAE